MSLIIPANSAVGGGYDVDNSLRFNDDSQDSLQRTPSSASNRKTWTWSGWIKRGNLGIDQIIFSGGTANTWIRFNGDDTLEFNIQDNDESTIITTQLFRDVSAWYHIVVAIDTTQGTDTNRIKFYVNGNQVTSFSTSVYVSQNYEAGINNTGTHYIGRLNYVATQWFDGYMSEVCLIDGLQLDPTSFGEFDEDSGIWKPIDVSGLTFGNNGFYLDFENSGSLGADVSGNGNNFTVNNLTSIDQTTDTPTNNFATLNPLHYYLDNTTENGNLTYKPTTTSTYPYIFSTLGVTKGKWYVEFKKFNGSSSLFGILDADKYPLPVFLGHGTDDWGWLDSGWFYNNGSNVLAVNTYSANDIVGLALDLDNDALYFSKNGTWETVNGSSGDPESGSAKTGAIEIASDKTWLIGVGTGGGSPNDLNLNFGSPPYSESGGNSDGNGYGNFNQAVPNGYYALNTKNLSEFG